MVSKLALGVLTLTVAVPAAGAQTPIYTFHGDVGGLLDDPGKSTYGDAIAGVGDVDGDGYDDVLVGSTKPKIDAAGAAYVFSGQTGELLYWLRPEGLFGGGFGAVVAAAGDVDADGTPDFVVGASEAYLPPSPPQSGIARVYSGATGEVLFAIAGDTFNDELGTSVAGAGDVNGDGHDDVLVGSPLDDPFFGGAGSVFVVSGKDASTLYAFEGTSAFDHLGASVASAGDVDGDGVPDVVAGAPDADPNGSKSGQVHVFSGATGATLHVFEGDATDDFLGRTVAGVGDVNGDGHDDVGGAAPGAGRITIWSGLDGSVLHHLDGNPGEGFGGGLVGMGDIDGDGFDDVATSGDPFGLGSFVRLYSGVDGSVLSTFELPVVSLSSIGFGGDVDADGAVDFLWGGFGAEARRASDLALTGSFDLGYEGEAGGDELGRRVDGAGDVDGDGYADLVVGAPEASPNGTWSGRVRVFSGRTGAVLHDLVGAQPIDRFGSDVAGAGDVDGDGFDDLLVAADQGGSLSAPPGFARVLSGVDASVIYEFAGSPAAHQSFADEVAGVGDLDLDGFADFAIHRRNMVNEVRDIVRVHSGVDGTKLYAWHGDEIADGFGRDLASAGDVNADGHPDVIVGAPYADYWKVFSGADGTVLYSMSIAGELDAVSGAGDVDADGYDDFVWSEGGPGSARYVHVHSGLDGTELYTLTGGLGEDQFGRSLAPIGDLDGDGRDDFLVGVPLIDGAAPVARVVSGIDGSTIFEVGGTLSDSSFGASAAGAGDVNGDGVPDFVVGVPGDDSLDTFPFENPEYDRGSARVFSGAELALGSDRHELSLAEGGDDQLVLQAGSANGSAFYWMFMSGSGTSPGIDFGGVVLPLNFDAFFELTLDKPFAGIFTSFVGFLDPDGKGAAALAIPPAANPALAGITVHLAYAAARTPGRVDFASNAVPLTFQP